jgi:hypothetical protein
VTRKFFSNESVAQALRQLKVYGHDALPVLSPDGRQILGWVTNAGVLGAIARRIDASGQQAPETQLAAEWARPPGAALRLQEADPAQNGQAGGDRTSAACARLGKALPGAFEPIRSRGVAAVTGGALERADRMAVCARNHAGF